MKTRSFPGSGWVAVACFLTGTVLMLSPKVAAHSAVPWVFMLIGNLIYTSDMILIKQRAWIALGSFYAVWNVLLIVARWYDIEILEYIEPITSALEKLI